MLGVGNSEISKVLKGETWAHVADHLTLRDTPLGEAALRRAAA